MNPHRDIIEAINSWNPVTSAPEWPDSRFRDLAQRLFAHQYTHNGSYRSLCDRRGVAPHDDPRPTAVPAVPTDAFKHARLFVDGADPARTFRTSGTTGAERGEHHFRTLDVYRASLHPAFVRFCNPKREPLRLLVLAPSPADLPDSSLSFMLGELVERHGDEHSGFFVDTDDNNTWRLDTEAFADALDTACGAEIPNLVFGTAFAFAEFFDRLDASWQLPEGSRIVETGGFKGRSRELSRNELYDAFTERLGVPSAQCVSEYSMTELSSQTYTDRLWRGEEATGRLYAPPWLRVDIVDPVSLNPYDAPGPTGLIRFFDLANVDSVSAIQTSDRGRLYDDGGFELLGRASGAELRGCSLTIEEIVEG